MNLLYCILYETNLYGLQKGGKYAKTWYDVTILEFYLFLGVCLLMGVINENQWTTQYLLKSDTNSKENWIICTFPVIYTNTYSTFW